MKTTITEVLIAALAFGSVAQAHMELSYPAPYRGKNNPNAGSNIDPSMTSPLTKDVKIDVPGEITLGGFPCKGYHNEKVSTAAERASVATWPAGSTTKFVVAGGATHGGGSCQASLSYDEGATFTVVASFIGSCPLSNGAEFPFTVPSDAPAGEAIFAWTWFNKIGNREMYMNCATVTISSGVGKARRAETAFSARPQIFKANLNTGECATKEGKEVIFPDPGPDVVDKQTGDNSDAITGCGAVPEPSGGGDTASSSSVDTPATTAVPTPSGGVFVPIPSSETTATTVPETTAAPDAPASTTFATVVSPVTSATSETIPVATPTTAPESPAPVEGAQNGACSPEGLWNCIGGTSFQQCASGTWSVVMQVAAGTKCTPGQSAAIDISAA